MNRKLSSLWFSVLLIVAAAGQSVDMCGLTAQLCRSGGRCVYSDDSVATQNITPTNFTVAFIGDSEVNTFAKAVLNLIKQEQTGLVIHSGDLGYQKGFQEWENQLNDILGRDFPYLASVGNHDMGEWDLTPGYSLYSLERLQRAGGTCVGRVGVGQICSYNGIVVALSGVGTINPSTPDFFTSALAPLSATWKICSFHKNMAAMQLGSKADETGWAAYDTCRQQGAIIATGHEHSYSRTFSLSNFETQEVVESDPANLTIQLGQTFAFVSGVAGREIRSCITSKVNDPWWALARCSTTTPALNYGALFCKFNLNGVQNEAHCYFKQIDGTVIDSFKVTSRLSLGSQAQPQVPLCVRPRTSSSSASSSISLTETANPVTTNFGSDDNLISSSAGISVLVVLLLLLLCGVVAVALFMFYRIKYAQPEQTVDFTELESLEVDESSSPKGGSKFTIE